MLYTVNLSGSAVSYSAPSGAPFTASYTFDTATLTAAAPVVDPGYATYLGAVDGTFNGAVFSGILGVTVFSDALSMPGVYGIQLTLSSTDYPYAQMIATLGSATPLATGATLADLETYLGNAEALTYNASLGFLSVEEMALGSVTQVSATAVPDTSVATGALLGLGLTALAGRRAGRRCA